MAHTEPARPKLSPSSVFSKRLGMALWCKITLLFRCNRSVIDRRGDFSVTRPSGDDEDTHAREVERSELRGLRHFPRSLRQWSNAVHLLESHGARVNEEGGAVQLVEHEQEPVDDEVSEFERLLGVALAYGKETESGIKSIRRRVEGARHELPLGWFIQELGLQLATDEHAAARVKSIAHSPASPGDGRE